ncbi:hypothetical protein Droror1_Dr00015068 [Drosera rotundifolia]
MNTLSMKDSTLGGCNHKRGKPIRGFAPMTMNQHREECDVDVNIKHKTKIQTQSSKKKKNSKLLPFSIFPSKPHFDTFPSTNFLDPQPPLVGTDIGVFAFELGTSSPDLNDDDDFVQGNDPREPNEESVELLVPLPVEMLMVLRFFNGFLGLFVLQKLKGEKRKCLKDSRTCFR